MTRLRHRTKKEEAMIAILFIALLLSANASLALEQVCSADCLDATVDCASPRFCGDNVIDPEEECDPPAGGTCSSICRNITSGSWPALDGSDTGLNSGGCGARTTYSGPDPISINGTTITNKNFSGISISGDNITISCSTFRNVTGNYSVVIENTADHATIEKSKIYDTGSQSSSRQAKGLYVKDSATNTTIDHNEFSGQEDGIQVDGVGTTITWNWFHHNISGGTPTLHSDGIAQQGGSDTFVSHNRFGPFDVSMNTAMMIQPKGSCPVMSNIDLVGNYIDGDGLVVATAGHQILSDRSVGCTCPTGMDITGNTFGPGASPDAQYLGVSSGVLPISYGSSPKDCSSVGARGGSWSGNVDHLGAPLSE